MSSRQERREEEYQGGEAATMRVAVALNPLLRMLVCLLVDSILILNYDERRKLCM